jgi:two-component system cell cycle response regulator
VRVLIAEDDPVSCRILALTLEKWGYEVVVTRDGEEAWDALKRQDAPNLALLDWMMPDIDGAEICRRVRAQREWDQPYIYLILLTAKGQKEDIVEGMSAGADDYIAKPFDSGELWVRLHAAGRILELESKLLSAYDALRHEAMHDHLTGLWNRSAILGILRKELVRAERERIPVSAALADIDRFKRINDTYGHAEGDVVLRRTAEILRENLREYDAIGRYGGEEFLIVLPGCPLDAAAGRADQLRETLGETEFSASGEPFSITICMGVAVNDDDGTDGTDGTHAIVRAADAAMYSAKRAGRNRVETAPATLTGQALPRPPPRAAGLQPTASDEGWPRRMAAGTGVPSHRLAAGTRRSGGSHLSKRCKSCDFKRMSVWTCRYARLSVCERSCAY